jgi:ParB/RepB/Spo0J family partition protein
MPTIAIQELKHDLIEPDPRNPRQVCDEAQLTELANDIAVRGILQPIVVRSHPEKKGHFMVVFGERRWRAAGMIDADTVPAIVRQYAGELEVLEDQIAENGKRADVHPLEEADAYRRLHEEHGRDVEEIAELCGKSKAYVYAAMKLCELGAEPRRAFLAGKFDKSVALLIARLPASQQALATKAVLEQGDHYDGDGTMSYREAKQYITEEFMLRLATAPFKVDDATLVAKAGPCTTCPKRTGNQRELFADVVEDKSSGGADVCTDSTCFKAKLDVHWSRIAAVAKEKGRQVLEGKAAETAGGYGDKHATAELAADLIALRQALGVSEEMSIEAIVCAALLMRQENGELESLRRQLDAERGKSALIMEAFWLAIADLPHSDECPIETCEHNVECPHVTVDCTCKACDCACSCWRSVAGKALDVDEAVKLCTQLRDREDELASVAEWIRDAEAVFEEKCQELAAVTEGRDNALDAQRLTLRERDIAESNLAAETARANRAERALEPLGPLAKLYNEMRARAVRLEVALRKKLDGAERYDHSKAHKQRVRCGDPMCSGEWPVGDESEWHSEGCTFAALASTEAQT